MHDSAITRSVNDSWLAPLLKELHPKVDLALEVERDGSYWRAAVSRGIVTDETLLGVVAARSRVGVAASLKSTPQARARVPEQLARRFAVLPLAVSGTTLDVATANPYDLDCEQTLAFVSGKRVRMSLAAPARIAERLDEVYRAGIGCGQDSRVDPQGRCRERARHR